MVYIPGDTRVYRSAEWQRRGRTAIGAAEPPPPADGKFTLAERLALTLGTYVPGPHTTGLLPGWTVDDLTPANPDWATQYINITPGTYENMLFWGEVRISKVGTVIFRNCAFAGPRPDTILSTDIPSFIRCYDTTVKHWEAYDFVMDGYLWADVSLSPPGGVMAQADVNYLIRNSGGIYGGRGTVHRGDVRNVQDGVKWIQQKANEADTSYLTMEGCWIHGMVFYKGAGHSQPEGTHSDGFQTYQGSNLTIRGCLIGGLYDSVGYAADPSYNSGDDCANSNIMIKQQTSNDVLYRIENVLIEDNFFWNGRSGAYCINHAYNPTYPNMFTTTQIKDNYFVSRDPAQYVIRPTAFASCYSNNKIVTMGDLEADHTDFTVGADINYTNG